MAESGNAAERMQLAIDAHGLIFRKDVDGLQLIGNALGFERHENGAHVDAVTGTEESDAGAHAASRLSKSGRQSLLPCSGSIMFSGCGIMPMTLPCSFEMPAMSFIAPLGLVPSA